MKLKCKKCGGVIESKFNHDFKYCPCRNIFIDGGMKYTRWGWAGKGNRDENLTEILDEETEND
jgi:hypothetical protein